MKKRLFSILISICMVFTMIPMAGGAVFAATATSVTIGGVELNAETPYYHNGTDGAVGTADNIATGSSAVFEPESGTLTIDELVVDGISANGISATGDLTIKLVDGVNRINVTGSHNAIIVTDNGNLTITGSATLIAENGSNPQTTVYASNTMTIKDMAKVNVTKSGGEAQAIHASSITISGRNTQVTATNNGTASGEGNASYALKVTSAVTVSDGAGLTAIQGGNADVPAVYGTVNISEGSTVKAGTDAANAATLDGSTTELRNPEYQYLMISTAASGSITKSAAVSNVTVDGTTGTQITQQDVTVSLTNDKFKAIQADTDVTSWFNNLPLGLTAKVKNDVAAEAGAAVITISGTPTEASEAVMDITIPGGVLNSGNALEVTANDNAKYSIIHVHEFGTEYISMGTDGHVKKCISCDTYSDVESHEFNGNTCALCGYTKSSGGHYKPTQKPEIIAGEGSKADLTLNGTKATITVEDGYEITDVILNGVSLGKVTEVTGLKTGDKVEIKTATVFNIGNYVKDLKLIARSSKTANKNVRVKVASVTDGNGNPVDLSVLKDKGYTVKYKFYRSEKKASEYGERIEKNIDENSYLNNIGSKGTKYFYKVRVMVYDASGNLAAQTELNQCKYATRTWSK